MIRALFDGQRLSGEGRFFRTDGAYLHTRPETADRRSTSRPSARRRPGSPAARATASGRWPTPRRCPESSTPTGGAAEDAGREPGEIVLQAGFSWAEDDDAALEGAASGRARSRTSSTRDDWHDPKAMHEHGRAAGLATRS